MKSDWIWMPHPGHFCFAYRCRFFLNTYVNGYIVSTVGEYLRPRPLKELDLELKINKGDFSKEEALEINYMMVHKGEIFDYFCLDRFGCDDIRLNYKYETMVFTAVPNKDVGCCPWIQKDALDEETVGYNDRESAFKGHYAICEKIDEKDVKGKE